jgi:hypothetical protein
MFMTGRAEMGIAIPPGMKNFEVVGDCTSECTSSLLPTGGITVISSLLHTPPRKNAMDSNGQKQPLK